MTRKHFEHLARAIRESKQAIEQSGEEPLVKAIRRGTVGAVEDRIARVCASFNPDFNEERFAAACSDLTS